jgi:hypothetical protein
MKKVMVVSYRFTALDYVTIKKATQQIKLEF